RHSSRKATKTGDVAAADRQTLAGVESQAGGFQIAIARARYGDEIAVGIEDTHAHGDIRQRRNDALVDVPDEAGER
ncbi:hypothetical protein EMGR_008593, partial [Emarellia grisea]